MVEGIENKEPDSPRKQDGEYFEEECAFLPPPKSVAHPRLFKVHNNVATEYLNSEQMAYTMRTLSKDEEVLKSHTQVRINNEPATQHTFLKQQTGFNPNRPSTLDYQEPQMPQSLGLINQTTSIP